MDMISNLPPNIIETILCFLPIQDAARTSILSKEWRYQWIKIPKLVFTEDTFQVPTDGAELSVTGQSRTLDQPSGSKELTPRRKLLEAINQVLFDHNGPVHEFTLSMDSEGSWAELCEMMFLLSQIKTVKKLRLEFIYGYSLPLNIISFHQLAELHLTGCNFDFESTCNGYGNVLSLYIQDGVASRKTLLHLLSSCPLLKSLSLDIDNSTHEDSDDFTLINLFERLPLIETLTIRFGIIECFAQDGIPNELPIALVHLKYLCIKDICFIHRYALPALVLLIKSSPNLEKLKLEILDDSWVEISDRRDSLRIEDGSDIWLEHLNELEITNMIYRNIELDFVKLILARSPMLKKVRIFLYNEVAKDEELHISGILKESPHLSSAIEVIVEVIKGSCMGSRSVM